MNVRKVFSYCAMTSLAAVGALTPMTTANAKPKAGMVYPGIKPCTISHPPCFVLAKETTTPNPNSPNETTAVQRTVAQPVESAQPVAPTDKVVYGCLGRDGVVGGASKDGCPVGKILVMIIS